MRLLVTGGRNFKWWRFVYACLDSFHEKENIDCVIHGHARGTDTYANSWAVDANIPVNVFPPNDEDGPWPAAGHRRNARMHRVSKPDVVMAFPGGKGTSGMIKIAKRAGTRLIIEDPRKSSHA